jgi:hypothetical protein
VGYGGWGNIEILKPMDFNPPLGGQGGKNSKGYTRDLSLAHYFIYRQ